MNTTEILAELVEIPPSLPAKPEDIESTRIFVGWLKSFSPTTATLYKGFAIDFLKWLSEHLTDDQGQWWTPDRPLPDSLLRRIDAPWVDHYIHYRKTTPKVYARRKRGKFEAVIRTFPRPMGAASVKHVLSCLKSLASYLQDENYLAVGTYIKIKKMKVPRASSMPTKPIPRSDVEKLLVAISFDRRRLPRLRDTALVLLLWTTGLRRAEITNIKVGDLYEFDGKLCLRVNCKGNQPRTVPLTPGCHEAIREWLKLSKLGPDSYLFHRLDRKRISTRNTPVNIENILGRRQKQAKLVDTNGKPLYHPHCFRAGSACFLVEHQRETTGNTDLERVRGFLGHASIATTEGYIQEVRKTHPVSAPNELDIEIPAVSDMDGPVCL